MGFSAFEGSPGSFSFEAPANADFVIIVSEVFTNTFCTYQMTVSGGNCPPTLSIAQTASDSVSLDWPTTAIGYRLESTSTLPANPLPSWTPVTNGTAILNGRYFVTNVLGSSNRFFRLRRP
jgi:hypothetical protein